MPRCEAQASLPSRGDAAHRAEAAPSQGQADNDLGVARVNGYGVPQDDGVALQLFARACSAGSADGCSNQGALIERGRGTRLDIGGAMLLYRRACEERSAIGCSNLGALYLETQRDGANLSYARQLFDWACNKGSATGCENRAAMENRGGLPALAHH